MPRLLPPETVKGIRAALEAGEATYREIADSFGVSRCAVANAARAIRRAKTTADEQQAAASVVPPRRPERPRRPNLLPIEEAAAFEFRAHGARPELIAALFRQPVDLIYKLLGIRRRAPISAPAEINYELHDGEAARWMRYQATKMAEPLIRRELRAGRTLAEIAERYGLPIEDLEALCGVERGAGACPTVGGWPPTGISGESGGC